MLDFINFITLNLSIHPNCESQCKKCFIISSFPLITETLIDNLGITFLKQP